MLLFTFFDHYSHSTLMLDCDRLYAAAALRLARNNVWKKYFN